MPARRKGGRRPESPRAHNMGAPHQTRAQAAESVPVSGDIGLEKSNLMKGAAVSPDEI